MSSSEITPRSETVVPEPQLSDLDAVVEPRASNDPDATHDLPTASDGIRFEILDAYLDVVHNGSASERERFLRAHPEVAELAGCLDALDQFAPLPQGPVNVLVDPVDSRSESESELAPDQPTQLEIPSSAPLSHPHGDSSVELPTSRFGKYELIAEIGRGGMGVIFKARHCDLDRLVALKLILANRLASAEQIRRFYQEAKAAGGLKHPNIVGIHDIGQVHGQHFFAMDYVDGETLAEILTAGPLDAETSAECLLAITDAVEHLHQHGVIHRDLKPSNILIDGNGSPFVTDFGLAKITGGEEDQTKTGTIMGTAAYMGPEQAAGRICDITARSDIYSLGAILYEMLTGHPPFRSNNPLDVLVQVIEGEPERPTSLNPHIPRAIELICLKCLEKDPQRRYATAAALAQDLKRFLASEPIGVEESSLPVRLQRWARREPAFASQMGAIALAATIVQIKYVISGTDYPLHVRVMTVFGIWMVAHLLFKHLLSNERIAPVVRYGWLATDAILLTIMLYISSIAPDADPLGPLVIGYPLLVIASGLFTRERLVWFTTAISTVSYLILPLCVPQERTPIHYPIIFCVVLLLIGFIVSHLVHRLRVLGRYCEQLPTSL